MIGDPTRLVVRRHFPRLEAAAVAPFRERPTSFVADAMQGRGCLDPAIKPLVPEMRFAGTALTINCGAADNLGVLGALEVAKPGDVMVVGAGAYTGAAITGDIVIKIAKAKGVVAFVTDGAVRDVADLLPIGLPIFSRGVTPCSAFPAGPAEIGLAMAMAGQTIEPGDLIMGDRDGVVVVPAARLAEITARLEEVAAKEVETQAKVDAGELTSLFPAAWKDDVTYLD